MTQVLDTEQLLALQQQVEQVYVDTGIIEYTVNLVNATRHPETVGLDDLRSYIMYGASPRASINLVVAARALAFMRGRTYVLPKDVNDVVFDVIRHRLVLSYEALSDDVQSDDIIGRILGTIPLPKVPLDEYSSSRQT